MPFPLTGCQAVDAAQATKKGPAQALHWKFSVSTQQAPGAHTVRVAMAGEMLDARRAGLHAAASPMLQSAKTPPTK